MGCDFFMNPPPDVYESFAEHNDRLRRERRYSQLKAAMEHYRDITSDDIKTAMQDEASLQPEPTSPKVQGQRTVSLDLPNLLPLAPLSLSFLAPDGFQYSIRIEKETEYQRMTRERQES